MLFRSMVSLLLNKKARERERAEAVKRERAEAVKRERERERERERARNAHPSFFCSIK